MHQAFVGANASGTRRIPEYQATEYRAADQIRTRGRMPQVDEASSSTPLAEMRLASKVLSNFPVIKQMNLDRSRSHRPPGEDVSVIPPGLRMRYSPGLLSGFPGPERKIRDRSRSAPSLGWNYSLSAQQSLPRKQPH